MIKKTPRGTWAVQDPKTGKVFGIYPSKAKAVKAQEGMPFFNPPPEVRHGQT